MFAMLVDDAYEIPGKGISVSGKVNLKKYIIKEYDCLYDFYGNQFWVKEINQFINSGENSESCNSEHKKMALLIEAHDMNKEHFKNKLLTSKFKIGFMYSSDQLDKTAPDFGYTKEYNLISEHFHKTFLADIEQFELDGTIDLPSENQIQRIIYRGKKLSAELYRKLYNAMAEQDHYLVNSPEQYEDIAHISINCSDCYRSIPNASDTKEYEEEEFHIFYLNGEIVKEYDIATCETIKTKLTDDEQKWLINIANNISSNFIAFFLKRQKNGSTVISEICDGQVSGIPFLPFEKFLNILCSSIFYCESNGELDPVEVDEDWKLEGITEFKTPVGSIIVTDEDNNRIPFTVKLISDCPISVYADDRERIRYYIYPTDNYEITISAENLIIGKKYRAIFTGGTLEYGGSDEYRECISSIIGSYSFAFGAYFPNYYYELSGDTPEEYITDFIDDNSGFEFELIDKSSKVWFEVSWLQNNDEPDECLGACECWVT